MKYGVFDRYFYKPLYLLSALLIGLPIAYAENSNQFLVMLLLGVCAYVFVVFFKSLHTPRLMILENIRQSKVDSPISKMQNLLTAEFRCRAMPNGKLFCRKEYGKGGIFWVEFELQEKYGRLEAKVHCNSAIPENFWRLSSAKNSIAVAARSVGYRASA